MFIIEHLEILEYKKIKAVDHSPTLECLIFWGWHVSSGYFHPKWDYEGSLCSSKGLT